MDPAAVAQFLRSCPGLNKQTTGELLGEYDEFFLEVLRHFTDTFDFTGTVVEVVRKKSKEKKRKEKKRKEKKRKEKQRKGKKSKEKAIPFGIKFMRSQVLEWAARWSCQTLLVMAVIIMVIA